MEDSKAQEKILNLGKAIVKELELDPGVDTLAKWMAHYVAEKMVLAEGLTGDKKAQVEKECFDIVIKLWGQRWSIPHNKPFLQDFEPLFETLDKLNPIKETPFFIRPQIIYDVKEEFESAETMETDIESNDELNPQIHLDSALRVDKLARSLIADLLNQAVSGINLSTEREELIRNSIETIDYPESRIIRITSDYDKYLESLGKEEDEVEEQIQEIKMRMSHLEEFTDLRDSMLNRYETKLAELEKQSRIDKQKKPPKTGA